MGRKNKHHKPKDPQGTPQGEVIQQQETSPPVPEIPQPTPAEAIPAPAPVEVKSPAKPAEVKPEPKIQPEPAAESKSESEEKGDGPVKPKRNRNRKKKQGGNVEEDDAAFEVPPVVPEKPPQKPKENKNQKPQVKEVPKEREPSKEKESTPVQEEKSQSKSKKKNKKGKSAQASEDSSSEQKEPEVVKPVEKTEPPKPSKTEEPKAATPPAEEPAEEEFKVEQGSSKKNKRNRNKKNKEARESPVEMPEEPVKQEEPKPKQEAQPIPEIKKPVEQVKALVEDVKKLTEEMMKPAEEKKPAENNKKQNQKGKKSGEAKKNDAEEKDKPAEVAKKVEEVVKKPAEQEIKPVEEPKKPVEVEKPAEESKPKQCEIPEKSKNEGKNKKNKKGGNKEAVKDAEPPKCDSPKPEKVEEKKETPVEKPKVEDVVPAMICPIKPAPKAEAKIEKLSDDDILPALATSIEKNLEKLIVCDSDIVLGEQLKKQDEAKKANEKAKSKKSDGKKECDAKIVPEPEAKKTPEVDPKPANIGIAVEKVADKAVEKIVEEKQCPSPIAHLVVEEKKQQQSKSPTRKDKRKKSPRPQQSEQKGAPESPPKTPQPETIPASAAPIIEACPIKKALEDVSAKVEQPLAGAKNLIEKSVEAIVSNIPENIIQQLLSDVPPPQIEEKKQETQPVAPVAKPEAPKSCPITPLEAKGKDIIQELQNLIKDADFETEMKMALETPIKEQTPILECPIVKPESSDIQAPVERAFKPDEKHNQKKKNKGKKGGQDNGKKEGTPECKTPKNQSPQTTQECVLVKEVKNDILEVKPAEEKPLPPVCEAKKPAEEKPAPQVCELKKPAEEKPAAQVCELKKPVEEKPVAQVCEAKKDTPKNEKSGSKKSKDKNGQKPGNQETVAPKEEPKKEEPVIEKPKEEPSKPVQECPAKKCEQPKPEIAPKPKVEECKMPPKTPEQPKPEIPPKPVVEECKMPPKKCDKPKPEIAPKPVVEECKVPPKKCEQKKPEIAPKPVIEECKLPADKACQNVCDIEKCKGKVEDPKIKESSPVCSAQKEQPKPATPPVPEIKPMDSPKAGKRNRRSKRKSESDSRKSESECEGRKSECEDSKNDQPKPKIEPVKLPEPIPETSAVKPKEENFEFLNITESVLKSTNQPKPDGKDGKKKGDNQSKNLHGASNTPAKSNKIDYKKEKNKGKKGGELPKLDTSNLEESDMPELVVETPPVAKAPPTKAQPQPKSQSPAQSKTPPPPTKALDNKKIFEYVDDDEDEEEEFVYKYSFRTVFIANACHICKTPLKEERITCRFCHLVGYCSESHREDDWILHQALCYAVSTLSSAKGQSHIYEDAKSLNGHDYRLLRMQTIVSCEKMLKRKLCPWEQEALLYPRICSSPNCREWQPTSLTDCKECGQVSYCSKDPSHLPADHANWCQAYKLYFKLVAHQLIHGRLEPQLPNKIFASDYKLPDQSSQLFNDLCDNVSNIDDCHFATLTQLSTAPLTALYAYQKAMEKKTQPDMTTAKASFCIHLIGAELQFEGDTLKKWETFFLHLVPAVKELTIVFIGPELNTAKLPIDLLSKIRMCNTCKQTEKKIKFDFIESTLYHDYVESEKFIRPDLICAFNCGLHRATGYGGLDTWPETIASALRLHVPFCITAYTAYEMPRDLERIKSCAPSGMVPQIYVPPGPNPYSSLRPDRNFVSDDEMPLLFKNYHMTVISG